MTPEQFDTIKQSPRQASVTDIEDLCGAYEAQATRIANLELAAQAVIDRWDSPAWKDLPATSAYINVLRRVVGDDPIHEALHDPDKVREYGAYAMFLLGMTEGQGVRIAALEARVRDHGAQAARVLRINESLADRIAELTEAGKQKQECIDSMKAEREQLAKDYQRVIESYNKLADELQGKFDSRRKTIVPVAECECGGFTCFDGVRIHAPTCDKMGVAK